MDKETAKKYLEEHIENRIKLTGEFKFPVVDEVVKTISEANTISSYTFMGLLKIIVG